MGSRGGPERRTSGFFPQSRARRAAAPLRGLRRAPAYFAASTRVLSAKYFPTFRKALVRLHLKNQATSKH